MKMILKENGKRRCVIVGAAKIQNYERLKKFFRKDDYFIFCDAGLAHLNGLQVQPDLILGDFDSFKKPQTQVETIILPREKDDTDSFYAVKEGLKRGFKDFLLLGVIGERFDHSFVNISALIYLYKNGASARIIDDYSTMQIVADVPVQIKESECSYFSLLPVAGEVSGVEISGAKYNLTDGTILPEYVYSSSNEVAPGKTAEVSVKKGLLLLVKIDG